MLADFINNIIYRVFIDSVLVQYSTNVNSLSPKKIGRMNCFIFLPYMEDLRYYYQSSLWRGSHCVDRDVRKELDILPAGQESNAVL